jgi:recombination protein RecT
MSTAVTTQPNETLASLLRQPNYANRFKEVLGDRAGQFVSSILSVGATMKDVEPTSIISSAMIAASLDLPINKNLGFAWIVPYIDKGRKTAQFQMGYKGFVQLALRSGQYSRMNVRPVNAEAFDGYDEVGEPIINWGNLDETKPEVGYVFAWKLTNGFTKVCYWSKEKVEAHAQRYSQSYRKGYESPWKTHPREMAMKTVVKNELARWGVLSIQFQDALNADQSVDANGEVEFPDNPPPEPAKKPPLDIKAEVKAEPPLPSQGPSNKGPAPEPKAAAPAPAAQPKPEPPKEEPPKPQPTEEPGPAFENAAPAAEAQPEAQADPETPQQGIGKILEQAGVPFDDFTDWLVNTGRYRDAKSMPNIDAMPFEVCKALVSDPKILQKACRIYGTKQ